MNIGGFQKNSMIDFPGTISCIIFTQGCNLICPYCHNPDLVASPEKRAGDFFDEDKIFQFLEKRKKFLQGVVITGGEPTLQKDLIEFCRKIKSLGYKLKLDSNGTNPKILEDLLDERLVDFISMDIKTNLENYQYFVPGIFFLGQSDLGQSDLGNFNVAKFDVDKIFQSIRVLMEKAPAYEFRTTCTSKFLSKEIMNDIGKMIKGAPKYILQKCSRSVNVLDPQFLKADNNFFSDEQMLELKQIIDNYVEVSVIR